MPNKLTLIIREAFKETPYNRKKAYETLLSSGLDLTFNDLEAMEECLVLHQKFDYYLNQAYESGNPDLIRPLLDCLPEKEKTRLSQRLFTNKGTAKKKNQEFWYGLDGYHPADIYLNCLLIRLIENEVGEKEAKLFKDYIFSNEPPSEISPEEINKLEEFHERRFGTGSQENLYRQTEEAAKSMAAQSDPHSLKQRVINEVGETSFGSFYSEFWHSVAPQGALIHSDFRLRKFIKSSKIRNS